MQAKALDEHIIRLAARLYKPNAMYMLFMMVYENVYNGNVIRFFYCFRACMPALCEWFVSLAHLIIYIEKRQSSAFSLEHGMENL